MVLPIPGYLHLMVSLAQAVILAVAVMLVWAGLLRMKAPTLRQLTTGIALTVVLFAWWGVVQALGAQNVFWAGDGVESAPIILASIVIPAALGIFLLGRSRRVADLIDALPLSWLVGAQFYRILGVIFLVLWMDDGKLPADFAVSAGWGDIAVGLLALLVGWMAYRGFRAANRVAFGWNLLGMADLVAAVGLGAMTSPGALHLLALDNPNLYATAYPLVMVPAFAVPISLILHGLVFVKLRRMTHDAANPGIADAPPGRAATTA